MSLIKTPSFQEPVTLTLGLEVNCFSGEQYGQRASCSMRQDNSFLIKFLSEMNYMHWCTFSLVHVAVF